MTGPQGAAALALLFSLVWSSAFIAGKVALASFDPATTLVLRFALSAALLAPLALARRREARAAMATGIGLGLLNNAAYLGLTFTALTFTRPVAVIVVVSCAPFLTMALAFLAGLERPRAAQWLGAAVAFAGVLVITGLSISRDDALGAGLAALGTLAFSAGSVAFRARGAFLPIQILNFWQSLAGAMALAPIALLFGRGLGGASALALGAILYLALGVTLGGMALWLALIRRSGAGAASAYHLMNPVFGALLAYAALGAPLRAADFAGAAIIAAGLRIGAAAAGDRKEAKRA